VRTILDFESRSPIDLRKRGVYVYAADPRTEITCCAVKRHGQPTVLWFPKLLAAGKILITMPDNRPAVRLIDDAELAKHVDEAEVLAAHNAQFERVMWQFIMHGRLGFPDKPIPYWQCSAARAAAQALPRHLDGVGAALGLTVQKDKEGHKLMLKMSRPNKKGEYIEDGASLIRLGQYCVTDADVEEAVEDALPPLPPSEEALWQLDQEINDRGIGYDAAGVRAIQMHVATAEDKLLAEVSEITGGVITSTRQRDATMDWLEDEGVSMDDMRKNTVAETIGDLPEGKARRMLEIRQALSLSSISKLDAMQRLASDDNRIRGSLLYYGATTGRWAGMGIQPQNFPRDSYKEAHEVDDVISGDAEVNAVLAGESFSMMKAASRCLRGMLVPAKGNIMTEVDFNAIEARVLAWLADEQHVLDVFRNNLDPYKVAASAIYRVGYDEVTKDQRQVGKVAELALGYQGWTGAFIPFAAIYGVDLTVGLPLPPEMTQAEFADEKAKEIIIPWRENRPLTCAMWKGTEQAALMTVRTGKAHRYGKLVFGIKNNFLYMKLPSGRLLSYPYPTIEERTTKYGVTKEVVTFMGVNPYTRQWERQSSYGGKFIENADQAISRDLMAEFLVTVDKFGVPIIFHAHDAGVFETRTSVLNYLLKIMAQQSPWCLDLPLGAAGWEGTRYKKD
jgi:DNA polymerase